MLVVLQHVPQRPERRCLERVKYCPVQTSGRVTIGGQKQQQCSNFLCRNWLAEQIDGRGSMRQLLIVKLVSQLLSEILQLFDGILHHSNAPKANHNQ